MKHEQRILRRFKIACVGVVIAITIGLIGEGRTIVYVTPHAEASTAIDPQALCELEVVECEGEREAKIEKAVDALSDALGHEVTDETKKRVSYLYDKANEAGIPFYDAVATIYCESQWQSVKSWLPEESYGLAQIHLPSHKKVTKDQALNAEFAISFLVENWYTAQAEASKMWYAYDRDTKDCTNGLIINL
jgi:hypothetical protein